MEIENGLIEKAELTIADHGLLSAWLFLKFEGSGQGFGGHSLYLPKSFKHHGGKNYAGHWIYRVLEIADVEKWSQLQGKTIRVRRNGPMGEIVAVGHIIKDEWFDVESEFKSLPA